MSVRFRQFIEDAVSRRDVPITEAQIVGFLREIDAALPVKDLCRKHGS